MEIRKIKKLIELLEQSHLTEIEIKEGEQSIRLSRHSIISETIPHAQLKHELIQPIIPTTKQTPHETPIATPTQPAIVNTGHIIRSPMVGTLYLAPSPEAPPFVSPCQTVKAGDILCIIEAMKMFNEIEADKTGTITEILVKNGEPVEYDQPLFMIEP